MKKLLPYFLFLVFFIGCEQKTDPRYVPTFSENQIFNQKKYIFGVHPLHNPERLFQVYQPLVDYINTHIPEISFTLEASRNYDAYEMKLYNGYFDVALPNPYQTIRSLEYGYHIFAKMGDDTNFKGIILVRKDSNITTVADLKGKTISYPAKTALAATMLPQYYLNSQGIDIHKDITNLYVGSQESSIMNVYLKKTDAAATWPPPWKSFIKERPEIAKEVVVMWETFSLPNNGLVAKNEMPQEVVAKIADLLSTMHTNPEGLEILKRIELSKFELANKDTYQPVFAFLQEFDKKITQRADK